MRKYIIFILSSILIAVSCSKENLPPSFDKYEQVLIITALGYNDLSAYIDKNINDTESGVIPLKHNDKAIVVFSHNTAHNGDYKTETSPVIFRIYQENGEIVHDTLKVYPKNTNSASAATIENALNEIKAEFPAEHYGMLFSSHATAWIPAGYSTSSGRITQLSMDERESRRELPLTKTMGAKFYRENNSTRYTEMNVKEFADAIPMHLDYIIMDACLMSSIECLWEFRDKCDYIIASPTEVLAEGLIIYNSLAWNLFAQDSPDYNRIMGESFNYYNNRSGDYQSLTISLIDCRELRNLAKAFSEAIQSAEKEFTTSELRDCQRYFYSSNKLCFFYDLRDLAYQAGADDASLAELDRALAKAVPYHAETPNFFGSYLPLRRCCGISIYLPSGYRADLESYYKTLSWSQETNYLQ